jgi:5'-nucleotidase
MVAPGPGRVAPEVSTEEEVMQDPDAGERKILYVDMDNVLVNFQSGIDRLNPVVQRQYDGHLDDAPGIFALMDPVEGAVEAFHQLAARFDTYILSTAPWGNPTAWSDKVTWVQQHLGDTAYKRLILTHHKDLNRGHYLIDDRMKNGADGFDGEHIHYGSDRFRNWPAVVEYLMPQGE